MILVLIGIATVVVILGAVCIKISDYGKLEIVGIAGCFTGGLAEAIFMIAWLLLLISNSDLMVIDEKIAMYEEENAKIENQIAVTVQQYQEYEKEVFTEVSPDSAITLVSVYPELKADKLVQSQIEVYVSNNEKIKALKEQKIGGAVVRWWLYFGG